jgi:hypothetical protein
MTSSSVTSPPASPHARLRRAPSHAPPPWPQAPLEARPRLHARRWMRRRRLKVPHASSSLAPAWPELDAPLIEAACTQAYRSSRRPARAWQSSMRATLEEIPMPAPRMAWRSSLARPAHGLAGTGAHCTRFGRRSPHQSDLSSLDGGDASPMSTPVVFRRRRRRRGGGARRPAT